MGSPALTVDKDATISLYRSGIFTGAVTGTALRIQSVDPGTGLKSAISANYTKGMIDEIRFYDRAILADEALQLALQGNTTPYNLKLMLHLIYPKVKQSDLMSGISLQLNRMPGTAYPMNYLTIMDQQTIHSSHSSQMEH